MTVRETQSASVIGPWCCIQEPCVELIATQGGESRAPALRHERATVSTCHRGSSHTGNSGGAHHGWRATFYTVGMEHSPTSATGTAWERTPWHATQRAAWDALQRLD